MEFLDGESLEDLIERGAPIALHRAINIINQIASALAAAHEKGIVHRDLKPENIMLIKRPGRRETIRATGRDPDGSQKFVVEREESYDFVKVLDFGIAKVNDPDLGLGAGTGTTVAGTIFGTPEYMSPESAKGLLVDHRSDIYSLGVIFYDMLTGRVPFEAQTPVEVLHKHINDPPAPPRQRNPRAEITEAAERLILKALAKDPARRHQSMDDLRAELQKCYGSVAYRRDAYKIPGARESGVLPRLRRLTEELDEWLRQNRGALDEAARRIQSAAAQIAAQAEEDAHEGPRHEALHEIVHDDPDWDDLEGPVVEAGGDEAPLLLTKKKR
jgi:serine/threonine-protein kinase